MNPFAVLLIISVAIVLLVTLPTPRSSLGRALEAFRVTKSPTAGPGTTHSQTANNTADTAADFVTILALLAVLIAVAILVLRYWL